MKPIKDEELNQFFGKSKENKKNDTEIRKPFQIFLTDDERKTIEDGLDALPRKEKALGTYGRDAWLKQAREDIEKGKKIKEIL